MIYTVGHTKSYNQYLKEDDNPLKLGKCILDNGESYSGGIVFKTKKVAEQYLKENNLNDYSVYGLDVAWNKHNVYKTESGYYALIYNTKIIDLNKPKKNRFEELTEFLLDGYDEKVVQAAIKRFKNK